MFCCILLFLKSGSESPPPAKRHREEPEEDDEDRHVAMVRLILIKAHHDLHCTCLCMLDNEDSQDVDRGPA